MTVPDSRLRRFIFVPFFLILAILLFSPARGEEGSNRSKTGPSEKPLIPANAATTLDDELTSARKSVKEDPANAVVHVRLAFLLAQQGALDEAMSSFDEALKLNPRSYDAKTGKGMVLARKGNLKDAERVLQDALVLNPNPVRTHYELGLVYEKLGDLGKANEEFKAGIKKHEQGR